MTSVIRRYYLYLLALTVSAAMVTISIGPLLIPFLYGDEFKISRLLFVSHILLLFAIGWRIVNRYILIGLGLISKTVIPILTGLAAGLVFGVAGLKEWGLWALLCSMALGALLIPGTLLPRLVRERLKGL